jgi:F-type H+-transporting ATPase subunit a
VLGVLPLIGLIALTALELLVALLQAYIFSILTAVYLAESIHPEH